MATKNEAKAGKSTENWQSVTRQDLKDIGIAWDEVVELAASRSLWH